MDITQLQAITEIQQSRSRFQLEKFVIGQHPTPEMRFYQICLELQDMEYNLAYATLMMKQSVAKVARLRKKGTEKAALKADIEELGQRQTELAMIGAQREVEILREMFEQSVKYTRAEIEAAQPDYWMERLSRQYELQRATNGTSWALLESMIQADVMEAPARQVRTTSASPNQLVSPP